MDTSKLTKKQKNEIIVDFIKFYIFNFFTITKNFIKLCIERIFKN